MAVLKLCRTILLGVVLVAPFGLAMGQSGQADVKGTVADASGAVVSGADVTLTNTDSGGKRIVKTGADGRYSIPTVPPGHYAITILASGFSVQEIKGLTLELDNHLTQDISLKAGATTDVIEVTGAVPQVDTTSNDVGGLVDQTQINFLPIQNRQYLALALLTPGTTQAASRSFYSNVQSGGGVYFYANGFSWDGVSNQQTEEGDPRQNIPEDAVGEFKTYTAQMPADLGWAMGGYTALVTKSGTNKFHGDAFDYVRNTALTADNKFTQASELASRTGSPTYNRNQFGGSVGGPLWKDKTHFFGAYERTQATTSWTLYEPAGSLAQTYYAPLLGTFQTPSHDQLIVGRVDHNLTPTQQVFFRVAFEEQLSTANGCGGTTTTGCYDGQFPRKAYVAGHTWEPTPTIVNEARFQYAYISYELGPWNTPLPKKPTDLIDPNYSKNITLAYAFPSLSYGHNYAAVGVESRWQVNDTITIQKGAHSIKIGADVSYVPYVDASASNLNGTFTFSKDQAFDATAATQANLTGVSTFTQSAVPLLYYLPSTQQAYFIEDSWKARRNLTVNAGLRYDLQRGSPFLNTYTPVVDAKHPAIPFEGNPHDRGDWNNAGPRIGFSYDPFNKQKDVIRGGYGVFYNFIETELSEAEKLNFTACSISLTATSTPPVSYPNPYGTGTASQFCGATANTGVTILSPGLSNPYMHQFTLGYSRQLGTDVSLSVDGIYNRGLRDYKVYDRNIPAGYAGQYLIARPNTQMAAINQHASTGASEYKGLFVKLEKKYSHRYMYTVSYALSSAQDNNPHGAPVNYYNLQQDWGPSSVDQRNSLVLSGSVMLPFKIMAGGIFQYRSREPFSVTTTVLTSDSLPTAQKVAGSTNNDGYGVLPYNPNYDGTAQYIPGTTRDQGNRGINWAAINTYRQQLNSHAAIAPYVNGPYFGAGLSTNLGPDSVASNGYTDFDLRLSKIVFQHNAMQVEVIGQAFNLFGKENYTAVNYSPVSATFGQPTAASGVQIGELAAKFTF